MKRKVLGLGFLFAMGAMILSSSFTQNGIEIKSAKGEVVACPQSSSKICNIDGQTFDGYYEISRPIKEIIQIN